MIMQLIHHHGIFGPTRQLKSLGGARRVAMNSLTNILPRYIAFEPRTPPLISIS